MLVGATACGASKGLMSGTVSNYAGDSAGYSADAAKATVAEGTTVSNTEKAATYKRMLIKNGELSLETSNVDKTYADILAFAQVHKGYEFKHAKTQSGNYFVITATIKISPEGLDLLMNYAGKAATVINSKITSDDITSNYYDSKTRLETKQKSLLKYYEFLGKAKNTTELLSIQSAIDNLTADIEVLEGQIKMWDTLVSESTLDITINQKDDPLKPKPEVKWNAISFENMGTYMANGFMSVTNGIVSVLQWIVISLGTISPILVLAAIVIGIILYRRRVKRRKAEQKKDE